MALMTYTQFMHLTWCRVRTNNERLGEAAFNTLATHYPHLTKEIRGTYDDPRYSLRIGAMCKKLGIVDPTPLSERIETPAIPLQVANNVIDIRDRLIDIRTKDEKVNSSSVEFELDLSDIDF